MGKQDGLLALCRAMTGRVAVVISRLAKVKAPARSRVKQRASCCAVCRRFQPVYVLEPSEQQTLQILQGLAERYERHHHCCYDDEALEAAVKLSHTYIADRFLPDKVCGKGVVSREIKEE